MTEANCSSCVYFRLVDVGKGECRRHAPRLHYHTVGKPGSNGQAIMGIQGLGGFPPVRSDSWCGEYIKEESDEKVLSAS